MGGKPGNPGIPDELVVKHFTEIIEKLGPISSDEYDHLRIDNKPSRWRIRKVFGTWEDCLRAVLGKLERKLGVIPEADYVKRDDLLDKDKEIKALRAQLEQVCRHIQSDRLTIEGVEHTFGVITDVHIGSLYADYELLDFAYKTFSDMGITRVLNLGDNVDGINMYKGHPFELEHHGADAQVEAVAERYPMAAGIETDFIDGNHCRSFWKTAGNVIGQKIMARRPDMRYLGYQEADIILGDGKWSAKVRLHHPEDGTAYAISYKTQKYIDALQSGTKPQVLLIGHYHKMEWLYYRNVHAFQCGCIQHQTPFMRGRKIAAAQGFWIIKMTIGKEKTVKVSGEFVPVRS